jgi:serine/threonine protein kinase
MGEVYRARDTRLGRTVAIKVLPPELTRNPTARQRLEREARAVAALSHPNICPLFDIGHQDGVDFLVLEYLEGETLAARLARGNLPLEEALNYALQIVDALAAAHRAGIIHRDLKPGNIMLSGSAVRLLDFGLAKRRSPGRPDGLRDFPTEALTDTGTILGTVQYMAPEQLEGREADERTDIFAFGVVLYEMLTGRRAFQGSSRAAVIADILHVNPPRPSSQQPAIPSEIDELVGACLVKDPTARYQSAVELQAWLSAARQRAHAPARSVNRIRAVILIPFLLLVGVIASFSWYAKGGRSDSTLGEPPATGDSPVVPSAASSPLIAVLPFRNLSPQSPQAFFSAGITEEIRGRLSKIGELRLMSRAAVEKYGENEAARAARELGVTHLVTGNVRFDRDRVRIAVELGDTKTGQTLWLEQYERELSDVFVVQSDIAIRVARALSVNLSSGERARVERRPTQSREAYELYLRQNELAMGVRAQNLAGMQLLREALALDPAFALAEARLAYRTLVLSYYDKPKYIDEAIALSQHALSLDPSLSRGHFAIASAYLIKGFFAQARLSFLRALELDPNDTLSMQNLSLLEVQGGRLDEGLYWASRAFQLSARSSNDYRHVSIPTLYLRDDESTLRWLAEAQRRFPSDGWPHEQQAIVEVMQDHPADALVRVRAVANGPQSPARRERSRTSLSRLMHRTPYCSPALGATRHLRVEARCCRKLLGCGTRSW